MKLLKVPKNSADITCETCMNPLEESGYKTKEVIKYVSAKSTILHKRWHLMNYLVMLWYLNTNMPYLSIVRINAFP